MVETERELRSYGEKPKGIKRHRSKRFQGDNLVYFAIHTTLAIILFTFLSYQMDLFGSEQNSISYLLSRDFVILVLEVWFWLIITSFKARLIGFALLKGFSKKTVRRFTDMNRNGINKIGLAFFIAYLLDSLVFSMGILYIIQDRLFGELSVGAFVGALVLVKFCIFIITRIFTDKKL